MIDYDVERIENSVFAESFNWEEERLYKKNCKRFNDNFIKEYIDKINLEFLLKHKQLNVEIRKFIFDFLLKKQPMQFSIQYELTEQEHGIDNFFRYQKLTTEELKHYFKNMFENYSVIAQCHWIYAETISTNQKITKEFLDFLKEESLMMDENDEIFISKEKLNEYGGVQHYFLINEEKFLIHQKMPNNFYLEDRFFKNIIFSEKFLLVNALKYGDFSKEKIKYLCNFLSNKKKFSKKQKREFHKALSHNKNISCYLDDDKEVAKQINKLYLKENEEDEEYLYF